MAQNTTGSVTKQKNAIARPVVQDATVAVMDSARFEQLQRIAMTLAAGTLTPRHLIVPGDREATIANCFRVANQAIRWGYDPFAVADESYVVHGRLGYQGKLVAAVVNTRARLLGRLSYSFTGEGPKMTVTVSGQFEGEAKPRTVSLSVAQAKTENQMWSVDPEQKLVYSGTIRWARRHCPEVVMGVLTDDDLEKIRESDGDRVQTASVTSLDELTARLTEPAKPELAKTEPADSDAALFVQPTEEAAANDAADTVLEQSPPEPIPEAKWSDGIPEPIADCCVGDPPTGIDLNKVDKLLPRCNIGQAAQILRQLKPYCEDAGQEEVLGQLVEARQEAVRNRKTL